jgi:hypothetical protein
MPKRIPLYLCLLTVLLLALPSFAQTSSVRPYKNGSVWTIGFIHMNAGMERTYLTYVATEWKREQEAMKKEGIVLSYKVISTESHGTNDYNLLLMTEYKDLASMEANEAKADALGEKLFGGQDKVVQGYKDRSQIREVLGSRLGREIVLEPK